MIVTQSSAVREQGKNRLLFLDCVDHNAAEIYVPDFIEVHRLIVVYSEQELHFHRCYNHRLI